MVHTWVEKSTINKYTNMVARILKVMEKYYTDVLIALDIDVDIESIMVVNCNVVCSQLAKLDA